MNDNPQVQDLISFQIDAYKTGESKREELEVIAADLSSRSNIFNVEINHDFFKRVSVAELLAGLRYVQENYKDADTDETYKNKRIDIYGIGLGKSEGIGRVMVTLDDATFELNLAFPKSMVCSTFAWNAETNTFTRL